jgi:hypothetical protein
MHSDGLMLAIVERRLRQPDCVARGWLLDGFPRTVGAIAGLTAHSRDSIALASVNHYPCLAFAAKHSLVYSIVPSLTSPCQALQADALIRLCARLPDVSVDELFVLLLDVPGGVLRKRVEGRRK